ncbi:MAG: ribosome assembly cofactor RimP [Paludibacteraceae bacterium]|nr:ribosome assembly cofactor RimP [Paludibacteraceae bacterium]MBP9017969.1 ribosome assembly cofactor RimP [Paludibacteraceae bacterium]
MIEQPTILQIVENFVSRTDFYIVEVKVSPENQILVVFDSFQGVSIDDCESLNNFIESKLDREQEDYELEVSSPGLTEPFKVLKQYEKNIGNEVEIVTKKGEKFSGILTEVNFDNCTLQTEKLIKPEGAKRKIKVTEKIPFRYEDIKTTKYILRFK